MDVKETLRQLADLESKLNEYFNGMINEVVRDMTNEYWTLSGEYKEKDTPDYVLPFTRADSVGWSEEQPPDDPDWEHVYCEDVRAVVRKEDYTLICIRTSTGDGCEDMIFDNTKEVKEG